MSRIGSVDIYNPLRVNSVAIRLQQSQPSRLVLIPIQDGFSVYFPFDVHRETKSQHGVSHGKTT